jgi:hypothetical protein
LTTNLDNGPSTLPPLVTSSDVPCFGVDGQGSGQSNSNVHSKNGLSPLTRRVMTWVQESSLVTNEAGGGTEWPVSNYTMEPARSPRLSYDAKWVGPGLKDMEPDTKRFSSNDWALWEYAVYLT